MFEHSVWVGSMGGTRRACGQEHPCWDYKQCSDRSKRKLILGSHYYTPYANWYASSNKVAKLDIFSSALGVEKMIKFTRGEGCGDNGDYLSWDEMKWNLHGEAIIEHFEADETCIVPSLNYYAAGFEWKSCMHFCENLGGGRVPPVSSLLQWERVRSFSIEKDLSQFWVPIHDGDKEGEWRDFYNHQLLNITTPWGKGEPNGGSTENCAYNTGSGELYDGQCEWNDLACLCQKKPSMHLRLRGLCSNSVVDKYFQPMNDFSDYARLQLVGHVKSTIEFDEKSNDWKLFVAGSNLSGTSNASHQTFLLGKRLWSIKGDSGCNINGEDYTGHLKLTGCNTTGQFTCDDGQCVTMEQRCNQHPDCRDRSDENNCKVLVLGEGYNRNVPPVPVDNKANGVVNLSVSIDILKLVDIDEEDFTIEIQFSILLQWVEDRATYQNLKEKRSLNALTQKDIELLWLPEVIYENTDQKESTRLGVQWEWKTTVVVERNKSGTPAGLESVDETKIFKGEENSLLMFQTYTHDFQCIFDLKKYPFDTQTCYIKMAMGPLDEESVTLNPGQLHMNQSLDMPIFRIMAWNLHKERQSNGRTTLKMTMVLKRKVTSELMTTYFPTLLLTAITFATTFFKPIFFEAALSVNLTTMLVMTTIFMSKMESLPPTSDIKMIDIWLILCQIYPFVEVVLLTAMEYQRAEKTEKRKKKKRGKRKSNDQIIKSISMVNENETPQTRWKIFADAVYSWKAPGLKTLGRWLTRSS